MKKAGILKNLRKYREYILYYSKIMLKTRVAGSYLGFLWLYIDPMMFMLIYTFVVQVVFRNKMENFHVFVLIGITSWNLFSRSVLMGSTSITRNKGIFEQVYFHKFVYPTVYVMAYLYEFFIAFGLIFVMLVVSGIPLTIHLLEVPLVILTQVLFTYGCTLIVSHIGVFLFDLRNILDFTLRFLFYLSPVMWSFDMVQMKYAWILKLNPMAVIIGSYRSCIFYGKSPVYAYLLAISVLSCVLIEIGYHMISRHEDAYARMM